LNRLSDKSKLEVKSLLIDTIKTPFDAMREDRTEQWQIFQQWRKAATDRI
jgi:hypothetical protein